MPETIWKVISFLLTAALFTDMRNWLYESMDPKESVSETRLRSVEPEPIKMSSSFRGTQQLGTFSAVTLPRLSRMPPPCILAHA